LSEIPQRWLSITGICTVLNLTPSQVLHLYKKGFIVRIGDRPSNHRYLEPTPEYAERLRTAAVMLSKDRYINVELPITFLFTIRELAHLMGWSIYYARLYMQRNTPPCIQSKNRTKLYTATTIRDLIFKRHGRKMAGKKSPLLLSEVIQYFHRFMAEEESIVPTDEQFKQDDQLMKKIKWAMKAKSPERETMLQDLMEKIELAKEFVNAVSQKPSAG
jgi:DNA-binding transcriptional MerR regulator